MNFKVNAEKLAKELDYVGHGGYEEIAKVVEDFVYCSCAHCGSVDHQYVKVHSLDPLEVTISSHIDNGHGKEFIEKFDSVDDLRFEIEEIMAGC